MQMGNNQQNFIHNLAASQVHIIGSSDRQSQNNQGMSIIDQLSAAAAQNSSALTANNAASLFDDFPGLGNNQQTDEDSSNVIPNNMFD